MISLSSLHITTHYCSKGYIRRYLGLVAGIELATFQLRRLLYLQSCPTLVNSKIMTDVEQHNIAQRDNA